MTGAQEEAQEVEAEVEEEQEMEAEVEEEQEVEAEVEEERAADIPTPVSGTPTPTFDDDPNYEAPPLALLPPMPSPSTPLELGHEGAGSGMELLLGELMQAEGVGGPPLLALEDAPALPEAVAPPPPPPPPRSPLLEEEGPGGADSAADSAEVHAVPLQGRRWKRKPPVEVPVFGAKRLKRRPAAAPRAAAPPEAVAEAPAPAPEEEGELTADIREFTPSQIARDKCLARTWAGGKGGQCHHLPLRGGDLCGVHSKACSHGKVTGPIPEAKLRQFLSCKA